MLSVNHVEVIYSRVIWALRGVSLQVQEGQVVALLGPNGAGKSTTLKAISGLLHDELGEISHGNITWLGQRIDTRNPEEIVRFGIIQVIEGRPIFQHLTVEENMLAGAMAHENGRHFRDDLERIYQYFPILKQHHHRVSGYLSGGEQQMLVIGRAVCGHPRLMMLDEPSLGLAPMLVEEIFAILREINQREKISILLVEQNARAALDLADFGYVMEGGRIVMDGTAAELQDNEDIKEFYLGLNARGERKSYQNLRFYKRRKRWLGG
ncbi:MAG: ABC transporter ATP-binding protein [Anaerolineaceae bacterium]|nr:ABC transporter ATP-binding protein [Anaerolineaceae bacterium]